MIGYNAAAPHPHGNIGASSASLDGVVVGVLGLDPDRTRFIYLCPSWKALERELRKKTSMGLDRDESKWQGR